MITFSTDAYGDISYFSDVAKSLLTLMGHSATVPGALKADEVAEALANLQRGLGRDRNKTTSQDDEDKEPAIGLAKRAIPLIGLLEAAIKKECDVLWE